MYKETIKISVFSLVFLCGLFFSFSTHLFAFQMDENIRHKSKVRAPELKGDKGWLNTETPLSIAGLKGKVILLDFWTYGCVNCIHIIPDLKKLEAKYTNQLVVIGVHSAKFDNEKNFENIRQIILRYGIEHPVVNDADFTIWNSYAVRAWPTQVLIDPAGYVIGVASGEGNYEAIDKAIAKSIVEFRKKGTLDETPREFALERAKVGDLPLAFPGKVLADEKSKRLFIADSNHNRVVVTDFDGNLLETIGNGETSKTDGSFDEAGFNKPQGMALDGNYLYVADTENHSIRRVNFKTKKVETIGGTGTLESFNGFGGKPLETSLRSPWDLSLIGNELYIAMAGSHQIWRLNLMRNYIEPYAGNRWERRTDGDVKKSSFSQPSGITTDGEKLFVADSEANIIREIDIDKRMVKTLVGGDLFVFGDKDGVGDNVRLQHPLGVEIYNGKVLIADTYNDKIKILDPKTHSVKTFVGVGKEGQKDGKKATFYEPGGISVAGDKLFIADTNNQAIRVVDLKTKLTSTLNIKGLKPPKLIENRNISPNLKNINLKEISIAKNSENSIIFNVKLPEGFHLNPDAPQRYQLSFEDSKNKIIESLPQKFKGLPLKIPFNSNELDVIKLKAKLTIFYCREDNTGVCLIKSLVWNVPIKTVESKKTSNKLKLEADISKL